MSSDQVWKAGEKEKERYPHKFIVFDTIPLHVLHRRSTLRDGSELFSRVFQSSLLQGQLRTRWSPFAKDGRPHRGRLTSPRANGWGPSKWNIWVAKRKVAAGPGG